jgi:nicotinamidase-related amidase
MKLPAKSALVIVDFMNLFDFPHSERLAERGVRAAKQVAHLKRFARVEGVPCIYANDNFGEWHSDFGALVKRCRKKGGASAAIAKVLAPSRGDLSVLKPRHSAFYGTPLQFILDELKVSTLIVTGLSADICVLATAQDAYVRKFNIWVPADCVAADTAEHEAQVLDLMKRTMKADIRLAMRKQA